MIKQIHLNKIKKYFQTHLMNVYVNEDTIKVNEDIYRIVSDMDILFNEDFDFLPACEFVFEKKEGDDKPDKVKNESFIKLKEGEKGWFYLFAGRFYTLDKDYTEFKFNELKYTSKAIQKLPTDNFLGIRSGYEMMNGVGLYDNWIKKAKFLGCKVLGNCEKKTLSGVLEFQKKCNEADIKPVIGMTIVVKNKRSQQYELKAYAKNKEGWNNLLKFNYEFNVNNKLAIEEKLLKSSTEGLYFVIDPKNSDYGTIKHLPKTFFYQLDPVEFRQPDRDEWFIDNLEQFLKGKFEPVSITDAFYLEKDDFRTRESLWKIAKAFDDKTNNQYFKNKDQYARELIELFETGDSTWIKLFKKAVENENIIANSCNFQYITSLRRLPKYRMTEEEAEKFKTNDALFLHLVKKGFKEKEIPENDKEKYLERLKKEIAVLRKAKVTDYFLMLHDIIKYSHDNEMITGIARGSSGGSLVSALLNIVKIDPLEFDLIFERFLTEGRMGELQECKAFEIETEKGKIKLNDKDFVRIKRDKKERVIFAEELKQGDEIIRY